MRYHHTMTYDAPAPAVFAMIIDPAFQAERCQAGDPVHAESSVEAGAGDGAIINVSRRMRIDPPGFVKKFTGDQLTIAEMQEWHDSGGSLAVRDGTLRVEVPGQPADVTGTLRLDEAGGSTTVTVDAEVKVHVPLFGSKVETYIAGILDKLLAKDAEIGTAWLARR
jgi:hypothetical protein